MGVLLNEALTEAVPFIPWGAGTISHWEHDIYEENLPPEKWNERWWEYVAKFQGVDPPAPRGGDLCDACTKTHVNDDPAQYYDYAMATVLQYQLHEYVARRILKQDPRSCNYYGSGEAGEFLRSILRDDERRHTCKQQHDERQAVSPQFEPSRCPPRYSHAVRPFRR